jgi:hypothetical protein
MGFGPKLARKMRNRSPETTFRLIQERNAEEKEAARIAHRKAKLVSLPEVPRVLIPEREKAKRRAFLENRMKMKPAEAAKWQNMNYDKWLLMRSRMTQFLKISKEVTGKSDKYIMRTVFRMSKSGSMKDFFIALRKWYERHVGIKP